MPKMFEERIFTINTRKDMSDDQKEAALAELHRKSGVPVDQIKQEYFASTKKTVNVKKKK